MRDMPCAPAAEHNSQPILEVLRHEFRTVSSVLEVGSGTGQHAVAFAAELVHLEWQTSDLDENHAGIRLWLAHAGLANVRPPLLLDVGTSGMLPLHYDAVFSANTAHIMNLHEVEKMFGLVSSALRSDGVFCLYGPLREGGDFNAVSNAEFDESLRRRDPAMGIRDIEQLDDFASTGAMKRVRRYAMPANNMLVVWRKYRSGERRDDT
ncbi:DUF938 domain-containing protein [Gammaproteobacteria bacterium]|jgi:SAM-dependent methyltransferase|nr:DUF938 domain-containing protein [Gammaproteobacteria bacterium]